MPDGIISIKWRQKIYIQSDSDGNILTFPDKRMARRAWENAYDTSSELSDDDRKLVCLHAMLFDIRAHEMKDSEKLRNWVIETPFDVHCWAKQGSIYGILCTGQGAELWHKRGEATKICSRETSRIGG